MVPGQHDCAGYEAVDVHFADHAWGGLERMADKNDAHSDLAEMVERGFVRFVASEIEILVRIFRTSSRPGIKRVNFTEKRQCNRTLGGDRAHDRVR